MINEKNMTTQVVIGSVVTFAGLALLFIGVFLPPQGEIHSSILVAFGEACTFAGALIGVDYHYKYRFHQIRRRLSKNDDTEENKEAES